MKLNAKRKIKISPAIKALFFKLVTFVIRTNKFLNSALEWISLLKKRCPNPKPILKVLLQYENHNLSGIKSIQN
ncbi:hypothetical protein AN964_09335 [Heyndrickxia shackletonii]|uniref:Uncharacterized protein n=1 Tax=Heyndrickxia shackletonii TaxID=157838 RepID=A0A0Q3WWE7_9BACI|nr:hypothetical protein AN964_09335 [Heyndrickxia shackletonii]